MFTKKYTLTLALSLITPFALYSAAARDTEESLDSDSDDETAVEKAAKSKAYNVMQMLLEEDCDQNLALKAAKSSRDQKMIDLVTTFIHKKTPQNLNAAISQITRIGNTRFATL